MLLKILLPIMFSVANLFIGFIIFDIFIKLDYDSPLEQYTLPFFIWVLYSYFTFTLFMIVNNLYLF